MLARLAERCRRCGCCCCCRLMCTCCCFDCCCMDNHRLLRQLRACWPASCLPASLPPARPPAGRPACLPAYLPCGLNAAPFPAALSRPRWPDPACLSAFLPCCLANNALGSSAYSYIGSQHTQVTAAELFDLWDDHCGRARKPPPPSAIGRGSGTASPALPGSVADLARLEDGGSGAGLSSGEGGEEEERGALLGDEVERRSWRRRLRWVGWWAASS